MDLSAEGNSAVMGRHREWACWVALGFGAAGTTAFLSLLVPSTAILVGVGATVATGAVPFFPIWAGAALGAMVGSSFRWWLGWRFGARFLAMVPLRDPPCILFTP